MSAIRRRNDVRGLTLRKTHLLAGLSVLAFASSAASANHLLNNNSITSSGVGNAATCTNDQVGSVGNKCTITITGNNDSAAVNQPGDFNQATITINGNSNTATIGQPGDYNTATITQTGDSLRANIEQGNFDGNGFVSERNIASSTQTAGATTSFSDINQNGDDNTASASQGGFESDSFLYQYGNGNSATVTETGQEAVSVLLQYGLDGNSASATVDAFNKADVTVGGTDNYSYVGQVGFNNTSSVNLSGVGRDKARLADSQSYNAEVAESVVFQVGNNNVAAFGQAGNSDIHQINQVGTSNTASATQSGNSNVGYIDQGLESAQNGSAIGTTSLNTARATQDANSSSSTITQQGVGNAADVGQTTGNNLRSVVTQRGPNPTDLVNANSANVRMSNGGSAALQGGFSNDSQIRQESAGNRAQVILADGNNQRNKSTIRQRGSGSTINNGNNTRGQFQSNDAYVSLSRGDQMTSDISQNGSANYAEVVMTSGVQGINVVNDPQPGQGLEANRNGGNNATVSQGNRGSVAVVTTQAARGVAFRGLGNNVTINQTGKANFNTRGVARANQAVSGNGDRISYTEFGSTAGNFSGANGQYVETYQQGRFDTATITQGVNADSGTVYADGQIARARAGLYQNASVDSATITQTGDNYGEVTQSFGQGSTVNLTQTDAGDIVNPGSPGGTIQVCDQFGNCTAQPDPNNPPVPASVTRQYNQALITQNGDGNSIEATQNTMNGYVSLFQRRATQALASATNRMVVEQGTGSSGAVSGAGGVYTGNPIGAAPPTGAATRNLTATMEQGGTNNAARVLQDGISLVAKVTQLGTGTLRSNGSDFTGFGANNAGNQVLVFQQGTNNRATATQGTGVRSSVTGEAGAVASGNTAQQNQVLTGNPNATQDEFYFAGGGRSAEIDILQAGTNNTATAEQRGAGQYARIDQGPGSNNTASILQDTGATNATAVIRQSGSSNTYYVVQTQPGQYISVNQTGNSNGATNITQRGGAGGYAGFTPPPGS